MTEDISQDIADEADKVYREMLDLTLQVRPPMSIMPSPPPRRKEVAAMANAGIRTSNGEASSSNPTLDQQPLRLTGTKRAAAANPSTPSNAPRRSNIGGQQHQGGALNGITKSPTAPQASGQPNLPLANLSTMSSDIRNRTMWSPGASQASSQLTGTNGTAPANLSFSSYGTTQNRATRSLSGSQASVQLTSTNGAAPAVTSTPNNRTRSRAPSGQPTPQLTSTKRAAPAVPARQAKRQKHDPQPWNAEKAIELMQFRTNVGDIPYTALPLDVQKDVHHWLVALVPPADDKREVKASSFLFGKTLKDYCLFSKVVVNQRSKWADGQEQMACYKCDKKNALCVVITPERTLLVLPHHEMTGDEWKNLSTWFGIGFHGEGN